MRKIFYAIIILLLLPFTLFAQAVNGYTCDFEDDAKNALWTLNAGPFGERCTNKWYIDKASNNGGEKGMYISYDEGATAGYLSGNGKAQVVSAYTVFTLKADNYELSFDWQAMGMPEDGLYVCWVPEDEFTNSTDQTNALPSYVDKYEVRVGGRTQLNNERWNSIFGPIKSDGTPHKLVFVWANGTTGSISPAACIDNINIIPLSSCSRPSDIEITPKDDHAVITWDGMADTYDVKIKSQVTGEWKEYKQQSNKSITINDLPEGAIEIYVRSNCEEFNSVWVSATLLLYYPNNRCVDFLDINKDNCYFGRREKPEEERGIVDQGYKERSSRHTVHFDHLETDFRTGGGLKTVSPYDIASVRLGNWLAGHQAESIIYDFKVDENTESSVLLLHYAVVLQVPDHSIEEQPRFTLDILNSKNIALGGCTSADFAAGFGTGAEAGWENLGSGDDALAWKNWTTVGVNLTDYKGQDLKIKLTTYDCDHDIHWGYAYFALSCTDGQIKKSGCGESKNNVFTAPDGFNYRWYNKTDPETELGSDRTFIVPPGAVDTFAVELISLTNPECSYPLYVISKPRYPVAYASVKSSIINCETVVEFSDSSYIIEYSADGSYERTPDPYDSIRWDFNDGTFSNEKEPTHTYPSQGGNYIVTLTSYLADCDSVQQFELSIPPSTTPRDSSINVICQGERVEYKGIDYGIDIEINDTLQSVATGCDSIFTFIVDVLEPIDSAALIITCTSELPYEYMGEELNASGEYPFVIKSVGDCDSINIMLTLQVDESLEVDVAQSVDNCDGDSSVIRIPYTVNSGTFYTYDIIFSTVPDASIYDQVPNGEYLELPIGEDLIINNYTAKLVLTNEECGNVEKDLQVGILYPSSIIAQRWNDVLGVKNNDYNGGYDFTAFQWYKNDAQILEEEGGIKSNLYEPNGLDVTAEYFVELTRASDGAVVRTCPMVPVLFDNIEDIPIVSITNNTANVFSNTKGIANVWNVYGQLMSTTKLLSDNTLIILPNTAGVYIIEMILEDGTQTSEKIIVSAE